MRRRRGGWCAAAALGRVRVTRCLMTLGLMTLGLIWVTLCLIPAARAETNRYALVVGNNAGVHPELGEMTPLRHAERDAVALGAALVRHGGFDGERVVVLTGVGREAIQAAATRLGALRAADRAAFGETPALFGFFFTGHGSEGALLTPGAPLDGRDLAGIYEAVGAELDVGFFDACHAGSLAVERLRAKGAEPTGFNPVAAFPEAVLPAEGMVWLLSSRPDEISFEHDRLGGLFTHYFIEAFTAIESDRFGVSLDAMWEHARRETALHARRLARAQTPQKVVRTLTAQGPIYFSFPRARTARLTLGAEVEGEFFLSYRDDTRVERVVKAPGAPLAVAIHPGPLMVSRAAGGAPVWSTAVEPGARLWLDGAPRSVVAPGFEATPVQAKGEAALALTAIEARSGWWLETGGRWAAAPGLAAGVWGGEVGARRVAGRWSAGGAVGYAGRRDRFEVWRSALDMATARGEVGWGGAAGRWRLEGVGAVEGGLGMQRFGGGVTRARALGAVGVSARGWISLGSRWAAVAELGARGGWAEGLAAASGGGLFLAPVARLGIAARLR